MRVQQLQVNDRQNPMGIDDQQPRFSWVFHADAAPSLGASSYLITVRVWRDGVGELWQWQRRGAQISDLPFSAVYGGPQFEPLTRYAWSVELSRAGTPMAYGTAEFVSGKLDTFWHGLWIGRDTERTISDTPEIPAQRSEGGINKSWLTTYSRPPLQLRHEFILDEQPIEAFLVASAHGIFSTYLNATRIGDDELAPGWTDYRQAIDYLTRDVTTLLQPGVNVLAAEVADGWWSGYLGYNTRQHADQYGHETALISELHLKYADGSAQILATSPQWKEHPGHIVMADLLMGEHHDSARATSGWREPGFDDSKWRTAKKMAGPVKVLRASLADPVTVYRELPALSVHTTGAGHQVVNFGQNFSGRIRLRIKNAQVGDVVEIFHGERLDAEGALYTENLRAAEARDVIVTSGEAEQIFAPTFTFHGFQYVQIRGLRQELALSDISAEVLSSVRERTGWIKTSSEMVNRLVENVWWSQLSNFVSVPTDCPQRDERLGWSADIQVFAPTANMNADVVAFVKNWLVEYYRTQDSQGRVPDVAPVPPATYNFDNGAPGWGDAAVLVPWQLYEFTGDREYLAKQYSHMKAWVDYIARENNGGLWERKVGNNYGDWLSIDATTSTALIAAACQIHSVDILIEAAWVLNYEHDISHYQQYAAQLRELFDRTMWEPGGLLRSDTQTAYVLALAWKLLPQEGLGVAGNRLVQLIEQRGGRLTTGFLGVKEICPVLCSLGRPDLAYTLLLQEEYPSWGYTVKQGATTIWERWDGWTAHQGFQAKEMNSFNHYSVGSVVQWIYQGIAGIQQQPGTAGFASLLIEPIFDPRLTWIDVAMQTPRGQVGVHWEIDSGHGALKVEVPAGAQACVVLPNQRKEVGPGVHQFTFLYEQAVLPIQ